MKLIKLGTFTKSPYPNSPYIAELQLSGPSETLAWQQVVALHETAREITRNQPFSWWCSLPPELWLVPKIAYLDSAPTPESLPHVQALRIDIKEGYQFSGEYRSRLIYEQVITLRKCAYRVRSDFRMYAQTGTLPTVFDWENSEPL